MGCANYFKFHPDATVHDYMKRFKVDSYEKAVDEIKSLGLDSTTEERVLKNTHPDIIKDNGGYTPVAISNEKNTVTESESYGNDDIEASSENKIHGLYVSKIQKMLKKVYDDSELSKSEKEDIIDALYGQLKELTSYKDSEEENNSEEKLSSEEKLNRIKQMLNEMKKSNKALMELPEFSDLNLFESQLMDLEQFDFLKEK